MPWRSSPRAWAWAWSPTGSSGWPGSSARPDRCTPSPGARSLRAGASSPAGRCSGPTWSSPPCRSWASPSSCGPSCSPRGWRPASTGSPLALIGWTTIGLLAVAGIRPTTRSLLVLELVSVLLIVVLMVAVLVRLRSGALPMAGHGGLSTGVFSLPAGIGPDALALAATSGFLAFAGFESAASLGEEAVLPLREIPRAIWVSVVFGTVFYVACTATQSLGFGLDASGVRHLAGSEAPLGELATHFVGSPLASALDLGAALSAVGAGLGGVTVGARMIFAFARDGLGPRRLAAVSPTTRIPVAALAAEMLVGLLLLTAFRLAGTAPLDAFFYLATPGVLSLLVMYVLTNVAAIRRIVLTGSPWETLLPVAGTGVAGYVLYRNVWPLPPEPYRWFPLGVLAWLAIALLLTTAVPRLSSRLRDGPPAAGAGGSDQAE
ncbi:MAG TPA: APC family permease [Modestobacter sp.]|nr:APC family permease [Modestobacter sp.]